jgi:two-component system, NarL family, sensor histidine kinase UhpB
MMAAALIGLSVAGGLRTVTGAAGMTAALLWALGRRRSASFESLRRAAERIAAGDRDLRAPEDLDPKLAPLARALNRVLDGAAGDRRQLRAIAARAFHAQETERIRIAHELQEETAQSLTAVMLSLRVARATPDPVSRDLLLDEVRSGLAQVTDSVRRYARGLHAPALQDLGVVAAIEAYAMSLAGGAGPELHVAAADIRGLLSRDVELALFRIVQEALTNAMRYSDASRVEVSVTVASDAVLVTVEDDGRGFDLTAREAEYPCLGLLAMRERALYVGGEASVESTPGEGTRILVRLPMHRSDRSSPRPSDRTGVEVSARLGGAGDPI